MLETLLLIGLSVSGVLGIHTIHYTRKWRKKLQDKNGEIRLEAINALQKDLAKNVATIMSTSEKNVSATPSIRDGVLQSDRSSMFPQMVALPFLYFRGRALSKLFANALTNEIPQVRHDAAVILEWRLSLQKTPPGKSHIVKALLGALHDDDVRIREIALRALAHVPGKRVMEALVAVLKDEDPSVRASAANILQPIATKQTIQPFLQCLHDESSLVRRAALNTLERIGDHRVTLPLIERLEDEDTMVRKIAARTLKMFRDERAVEPLIKALSDESSGVREQAAFALQGFDDSRSILPLLKLSDDKDSRVQIQASRTLQTVCAAVHTIIFGEQESNYYDPRHTLRNPDTSRLTASMRNLQTIVIHSGTYDFHLLERFLTYAINHIGQNTLHEKVRVQIDGDVEELQSNIRNTLTNLCRQVNVYQMEQSSKDLP